MPSEARAFVGGIYRNKFNRVTHFSKWVSPDLDVPPRALMLVVARGPRGWVLLADGKIFEADMDYCLDCEFIVEICS